MSNIKDLNIRAMLYLIAMVENKFIPTNAALDLDSIPGSVSHQMRRIEETFDFDFFIWEKRKPNHVRKHITGLTTEGKLFYKSVRWFTNSILISSEDLQIKEL